MENFELGTPALVCRWRLAGRRLPLENRHLRALAARNIQNKTVSPALVAWAKQHLEWTLDEGARDNPDGVLMLVVDNGGKAAISVGPYMPLLATSANDLARRAQAACDEAAQTGVSPEDLWLVRGESLVWCLEAGQTACGASSLIADLARTMGIPVIRDACALEMTQTKGFGSDEVFLVSDEHGVVVASDRGGRRSARFVESYGKLLESNRA